MIGYAFKMVELDKLNQGFWNNLRINCKKFRIGKEEQERIAEIH